MLFILISIAQVLNVVHILYIKKKSKRRSATLVSANSILEFLMYVVYGLLNVGSQAVLVSFSDISASTFQMVSQSG